MVVGIEAFTFISGKKRNVTLCPAPLLSLNPTVNVYFYHFGLLALPHLSWKLRGLQKSPHSHRRRLYVHAKQTTHDFGYVMSMLSDRNFITGLFYLTR